LDSCTDTLLFACLFPFSLPVPEALSVPLTSLCFLAPFLRCCICVWYLLRHIGFAPPAFFSRDFVLLHISSRWHRPKSLSLYTAPPCRKVGIFNVLFYCLFLSPLIWSFYRGDVASLTSLVDSLCVRLDMEFWISLLPLLVSPGIASAVRRALALVVM